MSAVRLLMPEKTATTEETVVTVGMESESSRMESQAQGTTAGDVAARMTSDMEEAMTHPPGKTDSPSKRKGDIFYCKTRTQ